MYRIVKKNKEPTDIHIYMGAQYIMVKRLKKNETVQKGELLDPRWIKNLNMINKILLLE